MKAARKNQVTPERLMQFGFAYAPPLNPLMFAVQMLVNTEKGDTFSFNEIKSWLEEAGFKKVRKLEAPGPSRLVLATKP